MREILKTLEAWIEDGEPAAVATVVRTFRSAPRSVGAKMLVRGREFVGSVSGGCVEAAVVEAAGRVAASGRSERLAFGVADDVAWSVGLPCGGSIEVFVEPLRGAEHVWMAAVQAMCDRTPVVLVTAVGGGAAAGSKLLLDGANGAVGTLGEELERLIRPRALDVLATGGASLLQVEDQDVFVEAQLPDPTLVIVGGAHIAIALSEFAARLGFRVVVLDPRPAFSRADRFPAADSVLVGWPQDLLPDLLDESCYVVAISHEARVDEPALICALRSGAPYVGALGSRRTHARRVAALREAGLADAEIARIRGPVGLDIGARTPEEIALSIIAEVVAVANERRAHAGEAPPLQVTR